MDLIELQSSDDKVDLKFVSTLQASVERNRMLKQVILLLVFLIALLSVALLVGLALYLMNPASQNLAPISTIATPTEPSCADWTPYKDEYCFKIFSNVGLQTFETAEAICAGNDSQLITVRFVEEQQFLNHFHFRENQIVDGVWLGARFNETSSRFNWIDGSAIDYGNWASGQPTNRSNYCLQMQSELEHQWLTVPCTKLNAVVCQKRQPWSRGALEVTVRQLRYRLDSIQLEVNSLREQMEQKSNQAEQKMSQTRSKMTSNEQRLAKAEKRLATAETKLSKAEQKASQAEQKLVQVMRNSSAIEMKCSEIEGKTITTEERMTTLEEKLVEAEKELAAQQPNVTFPVGFIYVQLPKERPPTELWPSLTWADVSVDYAGLFFRVEGGLSAPFGEVQEANASRISDVITYSNEYDLSIGKEISLEAGGGAWSKKFVTGTGGGTAYAISLYTTAGENRPRNMAMRVWMRSA